MGKKRRELDTPRKEMDRRKNLTDNDDDPLGKVIQQYQINLGGLLLGLGILAMIGLGLMIYGTIRTSYRLPFLLGGGLILLATVVVLVTSLMNLGRRLELRKRGVRYIEYGNSTEFLWDEITDVEVNRIDETYLGVASVRRHSQDGYSPSGPLTKTELRVTLHSQDGRTINLRPIFLKTVSDTKKLISQLRLRSGIR